MPCALVLTSDPAIGRNRTRVVETYVESMGLGQGPDMYCKVGGHRIHPLEIYANGWHHLSQNFDRVAKLGVDLAKKAGDRMMERLGMQWCEVKHIFMNVPTKHLHDLVIADVAATRTPPTCSFTASWPRRGYPGPCAIIHALEGFFQENHVDPGDLLASVVAESSKWMYAGFLLEYVG